MASKGIDPTPENVVRVLKGWIYHCRFLSRYAQSEKDGALSELEKLNSLMPLPGALEMEYLFDLCNLANQFSLWGMMSRPLERLEQLSEKLGYELGQAQALYFRAALCINEGGYREAIEQYKKALESVQRAGDDDLEAEILNDMGFCYRRLGDDGRGEDFYKRSLELRGKKKNLQGMAESLNNLGLLYVNTGRDDEAGECLNRALELETRVGDKIGVGYTLLNLGFLMNTRKARGDAKCLFLKALAIRKEIGDVLGLGYCYLQLAHITDDAGQAEKLSEKSHGCFAQAGDANGQLQARMYQAEILLKAGKPMEASRIVQGMVERVAACPDEPLRRRFDNIAHKCRSTESSC